MLKQSPEKRSYILSSFQNTMVLYLQNYSVSVGALFDIRPDSKLLVRAVNTETERNDGLRLRITGKPGAYRQTIQDGDELTEIETTDLSDLTVSAAYDKISDCLSNRLSFDKGRPFLFSLFILPGGQYCLTFTVLHPYMDGYAAGLTLKDTLQTYAFLAGLSDAPEPLTRLDGYLSQIAERENSLRPQEDALRKETFDFYDRFGEPLYAPAARLPKELFDPEKSRFLRLSFSSPLHIYRTETESCFIRKERDFCEANGIQENALILTALRSCYSAINRGQADITFYLPNCARGTRSEKRLPFISCTVSLFRTILDLRVSFSEALQSINRAYIHTLRNFAVDESSIVCEYVTEHYGFNPKECFYHDLAYTHLSFPCPSDVLNVRPFCSYPSNMTGDLIPIYLIILDSPDGGLGVNYRYRTDMYSEDDMRRLHNGMTRVIREGIANPDKTLYELTDDLSGD